MIERSGACGQDKTSSYILKHIFCRLRNQMVERQGALNRKHSVYYTEIFFKMRDMSSAIPFHS